MKTTISLDQIKQLAREYAEVAANMYQKDKREGASDDSAERSAAEVAGAFVTVFMPPDGECHDPNSDDNDDDDVVGDKEEYDRKWYSGSCECIASLVTPPLDYPPGSKKWSFYREGFAYVYMCCYPDTAMFVHKIATEGAGK